MISDTIISQASAVVVHPAFHYHSCGGSATMSTMSTIWAYSLSIPLNNSIPTYLLFDFFCPIYQIEIVYRGHRGHTPRLDRSRACGRGAAWMCTTDAAVDRSCWMCTTDAAIHPRPFRF